MIFLREGTRDRREGYSPWQGKGSRQKKEMLAWYGRPYDPEDIDEAQIRRALKRIASAGRRSPSKPVNP